MDTVLIKRNNIPNELLDCFEPAHCGGCYICKLLEVTKQLFRVLKPAGTLFWNHGDSYGTGSGSGVRGGKQATNRGTQTNIGWQERGKPKIMGYQKSLLLQNFRLAQLMVDKQNWILRNVIIWHKCLSGSTPLFIYINGKPHVTTLKDAIKIRGEYELPSSAGGKTKILRIEKSFQPSVHILFRDGTEITCSENHRFLLEDGKLVEARELERGLVVKKTRHKLLPIKKGMFNSFSWGWLIGLFLAEGSIPASNPNQVDFSLNRDELPWKKKIDKLIQPFGVKASSYIYENRLNLRVVNPIIAGIIRNFVSGNSSGNKRLTMETWVYGENFISGVMDGFLDGDAHFEKYNNRWRGAITRNKGLIADLRAISTILGYKFRASQRKCKYQGGRYKWGIAFSVKKSFVSHHYNNKQDTEIKSVTFGKKRWLYDLEVDSNDHLFCILNGAVSHNSNCMPSSVKDRFTVDYEPIFFFVKSKKYYFETQYEPYTAPLDRWGGNKLKAEGESAWDKGTGQTSYRNRDMRPNSLGRNMRTVWTIPTKPFPEAHFAVFPEKLIEPMIQAGCPEFICKKCGKARIKIYKRGEFIKTGGGRIKNTPGLSKQQKEVAGYRQPVLDALSDCNCNAGWNSGVVLDCFLGSGTTAVVANKLRRDWIGIELNPAYVEIAERRIAENPKPMI